MRTHTTTRATRVVTTALGLALTAGAMTAALETPAATAAEPVLSSASGLSARDIDGGTLQSPTALVDWSSGQQVTGGAQETTTPSAIRNGYVVTTSGTRTTAGPTGARTEVEQARIELRGRVPLVVQGLTVGCAPGGRTLVTVEKLLVGGEDRTSLAQDPAGTTVPLPSTAGAYDQDATLTFETTTVGEGSRTTTGLRIRNGDNYELRDLALGQVTCSDAEQPPLEPHRVAGVQVLDPDGIRLIDPTPVVRGPGTATEEVAQVQALGSRSRATDVAVSTTQDGTVDVAVGAFEQLPAEDDLAPYRPSALRVNDLRLHVDPDGSSEVTFDDPTNALFADGRWLNAQDGYIYSKVDEDGEVILEVRVGERTDHADGTTTVNALHYIDHTDTWPEVILGQVVVGEDAGPGPGPGPGPDPEQPVAPAGTWNAYGVRATGSVQLDAGPLVTRVPGQDREGSAAAAAQREDSTGQVRATGSRVEISSSAASAAVEDLDLFPGTDAAVHLEDLHTRTTPRGTVVTTGGGTIFGEQVVAGRVGPDAVYRLDGTTTTVELGAVDQDAVGLPVRHGLQLSSPDELATTVTAASVTVGELEEQPVTTSVTALLKKKVVRPGQRAVVRIAVAGAESGRVRLAERSRTLAIARVRDARTLVKLPRLPAGQHRVTVRFTPAPNQAADPSRTTVKVRVAKKPARG